MCRDIENAAAALLRVRERRPLVHSITNYVVMNYTANALLALGASPVMAHAPEEVEEMVGLADALVLNLGTLSGPWAASMAAAGQAASARGIPIVLDPVGAGATRARTETARRLIAECRVTVVRGNASEILAVAGGAGGTRGVDTARGAEEAGEAARELARAHSCVVAVTGATDVVTDGADSFGVDNGHPLMARITGSGCAATAVIGAFCAVGVPALEASASALICYGLAGERAALQATLPGSFAVALLDMLAAITPDDVRAGARCRRMPS